MINIRQMGDAGEKNVTIVAWYTLGTAFLAAFGCIAEWVTPSPWQLAALVCSGLYPGGAIADDRGLSRRGDDPGGPFEYGAIIYATVLGIAIWASGRTFGAWPVWPC